ENAKEDHARWNENADQFILDVLAMHHVPQRGEEDRKAADCGKGQPAPHEIFDPCGHIEVALDPGSTALRRHLAVEIGSEAVAVVTSRAQTECVPLYPAEHWLVASIPGEGNQRPFFFIDGSAQCVSRCGGS